MHDNYCTCGLSYNHTTVYMYSDYPKKNLNQQYTLYNPCIMQV